MDHSYIIEIFWLRKNLFQTNIYIRLEALAIRMLDAAFAAVERFIYVWFLFLHET